MAPAAFNLARASTPVDVDTSRRRDKRQLSCNLCRRRKLRCNRQQPCCSNCASRGLTCTYAEQPPTTSSALTKQAAIHDRIVQLEHLVKSLIPDSVLGSLNVPGRTSNPGPTPELGPGPSPGPITPMDVKSECGSMRVGPSELSYVGDGHWAAILDGIADLKDQFEREEPSGLITQDSHDILDSSDADHLPRHRPSHTLLLYGCQLPVSRAEILAALPPKSASDRYISRYFNRLDLVHCQSSPFLPTERDREKTVQCLVMGDYTKSGPYVLETLIHYLYIELSLRDDADKDIWFLFALEVNLAMRMGYHRDPGHFPGISPLQSEMRRRLWATVLQGDILVSSQMGMPRMISDWKCDTTEPRNLSDADLDENTTELPLPRPETELTPTLGIIARRRMFIALGAVADITAAVQPCSYNEVMRVDAVLHKAAANIPPPLKPKPMATSVTDSPEVIMARLFIEHLLYHGQIMLHRRFLYAESTSGNTNEGDMFAYSRTTCLDASLGALHIQHILDEETCPGGQLHIMRWRVSSIMNHTFLTATMVLCSMLHRGLTLQREEEIMSALRRVRAIWMRASVSSHEAKKAAETVSLMLARTGEGHSGSSSTNDLTTIAADRFVMPDLLGTFLSPDAQGQVAEFNADLEVDEIGVAFDEWIRVNNAPRTT
ncbi:fusarisetin A cluster transcription factor [Chaetomidium leptoderma]|uniref:Fusarisetin A cluster transcription factor n=1 Tax=Chaetomidium leptoderma TaxID=669021 RepID=A0AAN6VJP9_9PEZI|nr:fusarisetin A cluster transcription factor [Chaetomidium leptoderma]